MSIFLLTTRLQFHSVSNALKHMEILLAEELLCKRMIFLKTIIIPRLVSVWISPNSDITILEVFLKQHGHLSCLYWNGNRVNNWLNHTSFDRNLAILSIDLSKILKLYFPFLNRKLPKIQQSNLSDTIKFGVLTEWVSKIENHACSCLGTGIRKKRMLWRILILIYFWTQNKILLFKHKEYRMYKCLPWSLVYF